MVTGGPASRISTGHAYKSGSCAKLNVEMTETIVLSVSEQSQGHLRSDKDAPLGFHKCSHCGIVFSKKCDLSRHVKNRHPAGGFPCVQCHMKFAKKGGLRQHVKYVHEKQCRYRCDSCGKGYYHRSNYYDHIATHTGVKRNVCYICHRSFTFKQGLKAHIIRIHPDTIVPV